MTDFLLELRSEEIPARMQAKASDDLARLFAEKLAEAGLKAERLTSYVTPRRLALIAHGLPLQTEAVSEERKGPRADAPAQALEGFLRSTGLTRDQLVERADAKGNVILFAVIEKRGRATADVLAEIIPAIIRAFPWPKSQRWGAASRTTESLRWVRPLQGIIALLGEERVSVDVDGIISGRETVGHRFHSSGPVTITSAADYATKLRAAHVIVDAAERMTMIEEKASAAASAAGLKVVPDKGLVAENAGLTEWPVPLLGSFDPAFLDVPPEVIQLTMRTNQKYFAVKDADGKLAPGFVCTANIDAHDSGAAIVAGNQKVLAARLSDARFFWELDKKTKLEVHAEKLARITFHEKLGTVADKVERVAKLARWLVEEGIVRPGVPAQAGTQSGAGGAANPGLLPAQEHEIAELADQAELAAHLCKADLVTEMVGEFPELQGIMGGYYARAEGLPDAVADAIRDHYKPVGQGDDVPTAPVTVAVSLADKLDSIVGFFGIGEQPTGSRDPFALRRAALGVIRLIGAHLRLNLGKALRRAGSEFYFQDVDRAFGSMDAYLKATAAFDAGATDIDPSKQNLIFALTGGEIELEFFADRLKVQQREAGVRHDLIDAVFALGGEDDLVRLLARVKALQAFVETADGANLLSGYKRAANILKKDSPEPASVPAQAGTQGSSGNGDSGLLLSQEHDGGANLEYTPEPAEAALRTALDAAEPLAEAAIADERFEDAMAALATLRAPIDAFFETVTVNDADPAKRAARIGLLVRVRDAVHKVADFSNIEG